MISLTAAESEPMWVAHIQRQPLSRSPSAGKPAWMKPMAYASRPLNAPAKVAPPAKIAIRVLNRWRGYCPTSRKNRSAHDSPLCGRSRGGLTDPQRKVEDHAGGVPTRPLVSSSGRLDSAQACCRALPCFCEPEQEPSGVEPSLGLYDPHQGHHDRPPHHDRRQPHPRPQLDKHQI